MIRRCGQQRGLVSCDVLENVKVRVVAVTDQIRVPSAYWMLRHVRSPRLESLSLLDFKYEYIHHGGRT